MTGAPLSTTQIAIEIPNKPPISRISPDVRNMHSGLLHSHQRPPALAAGAFCLAGAARCPVSRAHRQGAPLPPAIRNR